MKTRTVAYITAGAMVIGIAVGFFIGRGRITVKETHTIEYRQGEPIKIDVPYPVLVKETHTTIDTQQLPGQVITIRDTIYQVDTIEVVKDYMVERSYSQTFFDSKEKGKLTVNSTVQYNKQRNIGIDYIPVTQIETVTKTIKPIWTPFVSVGYNSLNYVSAGAGVFYHNIGLEYNYNRSVADQFHDVKLKVKF